MVNVAIVCEGKDDEEFLKDLIKHLGLNPAFVSFYLFYGKTDLLKSNHKRYDDLKLSVENNQIEKVLFVVDADYKKDDAKHGGSENTQAKLNAVIQELGIETISSTYIMCDPKTGEGYLESLILATLPPDQKNCIQCFLDCSQFKSKGNHKAILNQIYKLAYPDAPYDFSHAHFDLLKTELKNLFI